MKTLHIFHHSNLKNGVDKTTCTLILSLKRLGVTPFAVIPSTGDVTDFLNTHNIQYSIIPYSCCANLTERAQLKFYAESLTQQSTLDKLIGDISPDVIHLNTGHLLYAGLAAARCRVPAIWHIHSPFQEDLSRYHSSIGKGGYIWLLEKLSSQIIGVSEDVNRSIAEFLPADRIATLYNGIDIDQLENSANSSSSDIRQELGLASDAKLIIGVGRISAQKDFAAFARIASLIATQKPEVFFIIAGPKQEHDAVKLLEDEITRLELQDRLFILGPRSDVPSLIAQSMILVSTAIYEGQGIAALEAMALEKAVVAMACDGLRECIKNEHDGLLVHPNDEVAAASAVIRLLDNSTLREQLGKNGKQSVMAKFASSKYAQEFLAIANTAKAFGAAPISDHELDLLNGLLGQINNAHQRVLKFEHQTLWQRIKGIIKELLNQYRL